MVSKASEDLPDLDRPVNTIRALRGRSRWTFLRLCSRAPRMTRRSVTLRFPSSVRGEAVRLRAPILWHPILTATVKRPPVFPRPRLGGREAGRQRPAAPEAVHHQGQQPVGLVG